LARSKSLAQEYQNTPKQLGSAWSKQARWSKKKLTGLLAFPNRDGPVDVLPNPNPVDADVVVPKGLLPPNKPPPLLVVAVLPNNPPPGALPNAG